MFRTMTLKNHSRKHIERALARKKEVWLFTDARNSKRDDVYIGREADVRTALVKLHSAALKEENGEYFRAGEWHSDWMLERLMTLPTDFRDPEGTHV